MLCLIIAQIISGELYGISLNPKMQVKQRGKSWNVSFPAKYLPSNVVHKIIYSPPDRIEEIIRAKVFHSLQLSIFYSNHSYSEQTLIQSLGG